MDAKNKNELNNMAGGNVYVGRSLKRLEDTTLLLGHGKFLDDICHEKVLYAVIKRSPIAHGVIKSIDITSAVNFPGVHSVILASDIGDNIPLVPLRLMPMEELEPLGQPVIANKKVRYVGEAVAIILAESTAIGEDALSRITLEIEGLEPVANRRDAGENRSPLFPGWGSNKAITYTASKGEIGEAFDTADYFRSEQFQSHRHLALPMEARGILAEWDEKSKHLTIEGAAKVPFANRNILSAMMEIPKSSIDLIESHVGGGFGARGEFFPEDFLIPFAARFSGRPVKWVEDRRDHLLTTGHAREMDCDIQIACKRDGTILGLKGEIWVDVGTYYRTNGTISPRNVAQFMSGPYRVPNIQIKSHAILTNKAPIGTYRGPGRFETDFFRERLFDIVAEELEIDKVEFRRRNLVTEAEMPYSIATIRPVERKENFDSGNYIKTLERCLGEFGWSEKKKFDGKLINGLHHGIAIGCFVEGGAAGPSENAKAEIQNDGSVNIYVGSTAVGQGVLTVLSQIAADALELPIEKINLYHGSTPFLKEGFGSYHSRSTVMGGSAILLTVETLTKRIRETASQKLGCSVDDIEIIDGFACFGNKQPISFSELARHIPAVEQTFKNHQHTYAGGSAAAHVTVDCMTGEVQLVDLLLVEDVGRIVNPLTLQGQAIGAMVQGLGGALLEQLIYDENGQLVTGTLADYLLPQASSFPNIRAIMLEDVPSPVNPLGIKGGGEGGILPMGGLMANAVASALKKYDVKPNSLPLSPPNIMSLISTKYGKKI